MDAKNIEYLKEGIITIQGRPDHYKVELHFSNLELAKEVKEQIIKCTSIVATISKRIIYLKEHINELSHIESRASKEKMYSLLTQTINNQTKAKVELHALQWFLDGRK